MRLAFLYSVCLPGCTQAPRPLAGAGGTPVTSAVPSRAYVTTTADFTARMAAVDSRRGAGTLLGLPDKGTSRKGALVQKGLCLFELDRGPIRRILNQAKAKVAPD